MAIYRNDQATLSFAGEAGAGGYLEAASATVVATGGFTLGLSALLTAASAAGDRSITVGNVTDATVGEYIQIGGALSATNLNSEIRKISKISGFVLFVDYPLAFPHVSGSTVLEVTGTTIAVGSLGFSHINFVPGIWETVDAPDLQPEITPFFHMSTAAKRSFFGTMRGRQTFQGGVSSFVLLNGYPLRFPIGKVYTTSSNLAGSAVLLLGTTLKGTRTITVATIGSLDTNDYIQIDTSTNAEVRQIISVSGTVLRLDYPLMFGHLTGVNVEEAGSPYVHTIVETTALDTITLNLQNKDSEETLVNDWIRRYVGGKVGSSTISASEGGMLMMTWDGIPFLDMLHNQKFHSSIGGGLTAIEKYSASLLTPTVTLPTTEPYYFSQGSISMFGITFAKIRNFSLGINNNLETYYFVRDQGTGRIPHEIREGRREYTMSATIALPDSEAAVTATTRTMFKELLLEGNYGTGMMGFNITLTFTRGTNDTIVITIPDDGAAAIGGNEQGAFIRSASHDITSDQMVQANVDILFRNLKIVVTDAIGTYP